MKSDFSFFLKVSAEPFDFDLTKYPQAFSQQGSKFVYITNDAQGTSFSRTETGFKIYLGYPGLAHCQIDWNNDDDELSVQLDELGLLNVFYYHWGNSVYLSNRVSTLENSLQKQDRYLSKSAVEFFLASGFLPAGRSFWRHIHRIEGHSRWQLQKNSEQHKSSQWKNFLCKRNISTSEVIQALRDGLQTIHDEVQPEYLRLSGGADSRIVSYLWPGDINTVSVHSPWMNEGTDLDVNIAAAWAQKRGLKHEVLKPSQENFAFFMGKSATPFLTGLCGGEFLGGQFHRVIPTKPREWTTLFQQCGFSFQDDFFGPWIHAVSNSENTWFSECVRVFLQSCKTTIYQSNVGSWSNPCDLSFSTTSPFTGPAFLKVFLACSINQLGDYDFYRDVFKALGPDLFEVPLSSQLTSALPELIPSKDWGLDPKTQREIKAAPIASSTESPLMQLSLILQQQEIEITEEILLKFYQNPKTRINIKAFATWATPRFINSNPPS